MRAWRSCLAWVYSWRAMKVCAAERISGRVIFLSFVQSKINGLVEEEQDWFIFFRVFGAGCVCVSVGGDPGRCLLFPALVSTRYMSPFWS